MNRKATILIPTHDNGGRPVPMTYERAASKLCVAFGGLTSLPACRGLWIGPDGRTITDTVIPAIVNYEAGPHRDETVKEIAKQIALEADQQCVYVEFATVEAVLVSRPVEAMRQAA